MKGRNIRPETWVAPCIWQVVLRDLGVLGWIREWLQRRWRRYLYAFFEGDVFLDFPRLA